MENKTFLEKLKFGIGDGNLQYYLYNWKCPSMAPEKVSAGGCWRPLPSAAGGWLQAEGCWVTGVTPTVVTVPWEVVAVPCEPHKMRVSQTTAPLERDQRSLEADGSLPSRTP